MISKEPTEEILTKDRLVSLLEEKEKITHYIGFEISGFLQIGQLLCVQKIVDFQKAGIDTKIFLADVHSFINRKLNGDLETIRKVAGGYFKEVLSKSIEVLGGKPEKTEFILGSKLYERLGMDYLIDMIRVSQKTTLSRIKRSITIAGRKEGEAIDFAILLYVPMQVADIFSLKVDIAHGGMDQRKAHVIALDVSKAFDYKPIAIHHSLLIGYHINENSWKKIYEAKKIGNRNLLIEGIEEIKMSKSKPETAIYVHDSEERIRKMIMKSFCPKYAVDYIPVFETIKHLLLRNRTFEINGKRYFEFESLKNDYLKGKIHPRDLKEKVSENLIGLLRPLIKHFREGKGKKYMEELVNIKGS